MAEDRADDKIVWVTLDEETLARYERCAAAAGRSVEAQIRYHVEVCLGVAVPDPGDRAATQHAQLYRRMFQRRPLQG